MLKTGIVIAAASLVFVGSALAQTPSRPTVPGYGPKCYKTNNYSDCVQVCSSGACNPNATPASCKSFCAKSFKQ
jgi:hypothetical protein